MDQPVMEHQVHISLAESDRAVLRTIIESFLVNNSCAHCVSDAERILHIVKDS